MILSTIQVFLLISSIICFTNSVLGEFTSPTYTVKYEREYSTIEIPWKFSGGEALFSVEWHYKKRGSTEDSIVIFFVDDKGKLVRNKVSKKNPFDSRIEFKGNFGNTIKDATLAIKNFMKDDEGRFTCQVDAAARIFRSVTIRSIVLSNVTEFKTVGDNNVAVQDDNVTLSCTVSEGESQSAPVVEIRKGDKILNTSTASNTTETTLLYHFERISKAESGTYTCQVTTAGRESKRNFELKVHYPPKIDQSVKSEQFGCLGRMISLDCSASGDPKPELNVIGPDGRHLDKKGFVLKKFGIYRCEASNAVGNASLNITVSEAKEKPKVPSFTDCRFTNLAWQKSPDKSVNYTLQVREQGSDNAWTDVKTSISTKYIPSNDVSLSKEKDYEFRVIAKNCVGSTESQECLVKGEPAPREGPSGGSNAGVIAGSVIAVLVVILIIVIVAVYCRRKKKRESPSVRVTKTPPRTEKKKPNKDGLLYSDSRKMDTPSHLRPPLEYRQDDKDEFDDEDHDPNHEYENGPTLSNNVPSWV